MPFLQLSIVNREIHVWLRVQSQRRRLIGKNSAVIAVGKLGI